MIFDAPAKTALQQSTRGRASPPNLSQVIVECDGVVETWKIPLPTDNAGVLFVLLHV